MIRSFSSLNKRFCSEKKKVELVFRTSSDIFKTFVAERVISQKRNFYPNGSHRRHPTSLAVPGSQVSAFHPVMGFDVVVWEEEVVHFE